jgi:hypothetical protein
MSLARKPGSAEVLITSAISPSRSGLRGTQLPPTTHEFSFQAPEFCFHTPEFASRALEICFQAPDFASPAPETCFHTREICFPFREFAYRFRGSASDANGFS